MFARQLRVLEDHAAMLEDAKSLAEMRDGIRAGDVYVAKWVFSPKLVERMKEYLTGIGKSSLPNYRRIEEGCPNFHRINRWDERSYVKACFHQFSFFPWNQDVFDLFALSKPVYQMKNLLSGNDKDRFLGRSPEDGCASRLSFQFYPKGLGGMNKHQDPVDHHQLTVPTLVMSKKGRDFSKGGLFVEKSGGERICLDDATEPGDVLYFNAQTPHGVERIDEGGEPDWLSFSGRWTLIFAVNKLDGNSAVGDSVDLEKR